MKIESPALLNINGKLILVIPSATISPFKMNRTVDIIMISKEDYSKNEYHIKDFIGETTQIIYI